MKKHILPVFLLIAAIWFFYAQTGSFEFLRLDDHDYTFRCAFVKDGLSAANIAEAFTNPRHAAIWMPITYISYMADISLFGPGMGPHHLVNVVFHTLNAILVYFLLLTILRKRSDNGAKSGQSKKNGGVIRTTLPFVLATAFWALHPQRAEAVAWIAGRKELLCTFFTLLGLLCWIRPGRLATLSAIVCCALACMSKPTAMCFPFLAVLCVGFHCGTVRGEIPRDSTTDAPLAKWGLVRYLPLLVLSLATGALAIYSQTHPEGRPELALFSASLPWRLLNAAVAIGLYLFQTVIPLGIHLDYQATPGMFPVNGVIGLLSLLAVLVLLIGLSIKRWRSEHTPLSSPLVLFLFLLLGLAPTLGIFGSFGEHARADRFYYLPSIACSIGLALLLLRPSWPRLLLGGAFILFTSCCSIPVVASYRNDYTAFSRTLQFESDNGRALAHVASEECARFGRIDRGITLFRKSQEVRPRDDTAAQLAYTLALRGFSSDTAEIRRLCAKFACNHSLDVKGMALEALGTTAMRQRRWSEAISCLEDSIKAPQRFYSDEDARLRLGACYCNAKRPEDAIRVFEPLTQSRRTDIAGRARQFLGMVKKNPNSILLF